MFEIISLGRMDFLMAVLNGLAILTADDGPAGYGGLVGLGLLIGVLLAMVRGVVTQKLELQWVFAGWLLFTTLFVPKVDVTVEDIYTGETNTVANVPLGPAAIGSITSTIGITLAGAFETVFAYPSLTTAGYMDSLDLINAMREIDFGGANDGDASSAVANVDLQRSIREYLVRCVMQSISMGIPGIGPNWSNLRETDDLLAAIQVNTNIWTTTVYLDPAEPTGVALGCGDAYTQIVAFIDDSFYPAWTAYIGAQLGLEDTEVQVQDSLDALFGLGADARNYMLNSLLKREIELADLGYHAGGGNDAGVLMRVQAMEQRRAQWAAEQSLWAEMARPAISFIEGFFYAASPFMGFMFCIGAPGITIFGRYLVFAVWIQLWMPILAVTNLYITIAAQNDLQRIQASGTNLLSMTGLESVWTETSSWLAFGGNMVAATPLLTFILLTGSYFALTRLTDRLGGADHVNERVTAPDIVHPAPVASMGAFGQQAPSYVTDAHVGGRSYGAEAMFGNISAGAALGAAVSSRTSGVVDAVQRLGTESGSSVDFSQREQYERFLASSQGVSTQSRDTQTDQLLRSMAINVVGGRERFANLTETDQQTVQGMVALGLMGMGTGGSVNALGQNLSSASKSEVDRWSDAITNGVSRNTSHAVEFARAVSADEQDGVRSSALVGLGVTSSERWSKSVAATQSAVDAYDEVRSFQERMGHDWNDKALAVGNRLRGTEAANELFVLATSNGLGDVVQTKAGILSRMGDVDKEVAYIAVAASELVSSGSPEAALSALRILGAVGAPSLQGDMDARGNSDIAKDAENLQPQAIGAEVEARVPASLAEPSEIRDRVSSRVGSTAWGSSVDQHSAGGAEHVVSAHEELRAAQDARFKDHRNEIESLSRGEERSFVNDHFKDERSFLGALNDNSWLKPILGDFKVLGGSMEKASQEYKQTYDDVLEKTGSESLARAAGAFAGARGFVNGGDVAIKETYADAVVEAREHDLPDAAAHFYGVASSMTEYATGGAFSDIWTEKEELRQLKHETESQIGSRATEALLRAAKGDGATTERYLSEARVLVDRNGN